MVHQNGFSVQIRDGFDGEVMQEYDSESGTKTRVSIEAVKGATICPEITIHPEFKWHNADGLYVAIRYGSTPYEITLWVPDPFRGKESTEREDWTFQIPGKDCWDSSTEKTVHFKYQFRDIQVGNMTPNRI